MKKYYTLVLLLALGIFASTHLSAQRPPRLQKNIVKINPLSLATLTFNTSYERLLTDRSGLQLGLFYTGMNIGGFAYSGFGITPEVRLYMFSEAPAPEGFHISPFVRFQYFDLEMDGFFEGNEKMNAHSLSTGVLLGYQFLLGRKERMTLDLFAGPMLVNAKADLKGFFAQHQQEMDGYGMRSGLSGRAGLTLGFAF